MTIFRPLVGDLLRFLSKKCETYYRGYRDQQVPHGVPEFVAVALPGTEKRPCLAIRATQKPDTAGLLSQSATKQATKQGASTAPTGQIRGEMLPQSASHRSLADTHLTTSVRFVFSLTIRRQQNRHTAHQLRTRSASDISSNQLGLTNTRPRPSELPDG